MGLRGWTFGVVAVLFVLALKLLVETDFLGMFDVCRV